MRAGAKRERFRAQGACRALSDARYLDFDRAVTSLRTHEHAAARVVAEEEGVLEGLHASVHVKEAVRRHVWAGAAYEMFRAVGDDGGLPGERVRFNSISIRFNSTLTRH